MLIHELVLLCVISALIFLRQRQEGHLCDIALQVGNKEFLAHRNVLSASSEYFSKMFTIEVKNCSCDNSSFITAADSKV